MSHVKNVQAFGKLTGICTGYGGTYNPGQQNLQANAMAAKLNIAQQMMEEVNEAQTFYDYASNTRVVGFRGVRKLSSRICALLKSCGAHPLTVKDALASNRKLWGVKRTPLPEVKEGQEKPKTTATSGHDFASLVQHFARLVETVSAEAKYKPNETELTIAGLRQKVAELRSLNDAATQAEIDLSQARRKRNALYYVDEGNLFSTAIAAKQYVRGVFGYNSSQHQEVRRVRFVKPKQ